LQVINSSPGDLAPVFGAILEKAHSLCDIAQGSLELYDGEWFRAVAVRGLSDEFAEILRQGCLAAENPATQPLIEGRRFAHILDLAETDYTVTRSAAELDAARTLLCVPLRRDGVLLGMIASARREVRPFSDKEIALMENFAAQAVIAMENARLLTETREALEHQTATAEVLQVINSSPGDLAPVFEAMVEKAVRLCEADEAAVRTSDGELLHLVAACGEPQVFERLRQLGPSRLDRPGGLYDQIARGERVTHIADVRETDTFRDNPAARKRLELRNIRTWLAVALRKEGALLGVINVHRHEVRPFSDKRIALLQNFADQAVIAIENARLITETREALEQQTATAEVLQIINSSPGELGPVFDAILDKAHTLCGATLGSLFLFDGELFRAAATQGYPEDLAQRLRRGVALSTTAQLLDGNVRWVHNPDLTLLDNPTARAVSGRGGVRTNLMLPLRKDGRLLGAISCNRQEVRPFTEKEIALLQNFAAQAVIAMENARLLTETREALEQQTATAEVLQVINSSPGDLAPVFDATLDKALRLCEAAFGALSIYEGNDLHQVVAMRGVPVAIAELLRQPVHLGPETGMGRLVRGERFVHTSDASDDDGYRFGNPIRRALVDVGGTRTYLAVPLAKTM
jgi:GAF domain-containing protein